MIDLNEEYFLPLEGLDKKEVVKVIEDHPELSWYEGNNLSQSNGLSLDKKTIVCRWHRSTPLESEVVITLDDLRQSHSKTKEDARIAEWRNRLNAIADLEAFKAQKLEELEKAREASRIASSNVEVAREEFRQFMERGVD